MLSSETSSGAELVWSSRTADEWLASRALSYAEGCFETMRSCAGRVPLWPWHLARLQRTALHFAWPQTEFSELETAVQGAARAYPNATLKLLAGNINPARGYADRAAPRVGFLLYASDAPAPRTLHLQQAWRIAHAEPAAGLKTFARHLQLSLAADVMLPSCNDWLVLDAEGHLNCARSGNVYLRIGEQVVTPVLRNGGVHGVARAALLDHWPRLQCAKLGIEDLLQADEMFCSNALRGIETVASVRLMSDLQKQFAQHDTSLEARAVLLKIGFEAAL